MSQDYGDGHMAGCDATKGGMATKGSVEYTETEEEKAQPKGSTAKKKAVCDLQFTVDRSMIDELGQAKRAEARAEALQKRTEALQKQEEIQSRRLINQQIIEQSRVELQRHRLLVEKKKREVRVTCNYVGSSVHVRRCCVCVFFGFGICEGRGLYN